MVLARFLKAALILIAALAYLGDGVRGHMQVSGGETIRVMMCGPGSTKFVDIDIPGGEEIPAEKCCGDCAPVYAGAPAHPGLYAFAIHYAPHVPGIVNEPLSPRSPLWPGAPPQGPPLSHLA